MLSLIVFLFAVLWLPYRSLLVYNSIASRPYLNGWYLLFCKTLVFVNSAVNPILYNFMSNKFKKQFRNIFSHIYRKQSKRHPHHPHHHLYQHRQFNQLHRHHSPISIRSHRFGPIDTPTNEQVSNC